MSSVYLLEYCAFATLHSPIEAGVWIPALVFFIVCLNSDDLRRRKTLGVRMMPGSGVFLPMKRVVPLDAMAMVDDDLLSDAGAPGKAVLSAASRGR